MRRGVIRRAGAVREGLFAVVAAGIKNCELHGRGKPIENGFAAKSRPQMARPPDRPSPGPPLPGAPISRLASASPPKAPLMKLP
jgi:hypothetical protein